MKYALRQFYVLILWLIISRTLSAQDMTNDFCERIRMDQSNLFDSSLTGAENQMRATERRATFLTNFNIIISELENRSHVVASDSCFQKLVPITLIHMAQAHPDILFNSANVKKIAVFQKKQHITLKSLRSTIFFYANFTEIRCSSHKKLVENAINEWGINEETNDQFGEISNISYVQCE